MNSHRRAGCEERLVPSVLSKTGLGDTKAQQQVCKEGPRVRLQLTSLGDESLLTTHRTPGTSPHTEHETLSSCTHPTGGLKPPW